MKIVTFKVIICRQFLKIVKIIFPSWISAEVWTLLVYKRQINKDFNNK